jgi:putative addiction module component (TIGR02574 family)
MSGRLDELKREAVKLSDNERVELALALIESLEGPAEGGGGEEAWRIEIDRHSAELMRGDVRPVPGDRVFARLRERLG